MEDIRVNKPNQFVIGREFHTRKVTVKQNALATADYPQGLLLKLDSDGKMIPATEASNALCALLNPIDKARITAGNVSAEVVYLSKVGKDKIVEANGSLRITDKFIEGALKNGIDIRKQEPDTRVKVDVLVVSGDFTNTQYTDAPVDKTGLTFKVKYTDGSEKSVNASSVSASDWGDEAGEQTATFSYSEEGYTAYGTKKATVVLDTPASLAITGDWTNTQVVETAVDPTGLTIKATWTSGKVTDVTDDAEVSPETWGDTAGEQTATFTYTANEVSVTATKTATVSAGT